jgi:hypothetical protein
MVLDAEWLPAWVIGLRGMSRCRHAYRADWLVGVSARIR